MVCTIKLHEDGSLTVPPEALRELGWRPGEELTLEIDGRRARLIGPQRDPATGKTQEDMTSEERAEAFDRWVKEYGGSLKGGMTTDELMELTRGDD